MKSPLRAALVGAGFIGPVHAEALRRLGIPLVGVLASNPTSTRRMAGLLGGTTPYDDYAQLLADPRVDVLHITTPNKMHVEQARKALLAGKHVLCEKPLAMSSEESRELVSLAEKSRLAAGVCYNIRYYPLCLEARARIRRGDIGEVLSISGSYVQDWLLKDTDYNWRVIAEDGGRLRAVADIGTHWLDLAQFLTGLQVESVCADLRTVHQTRKRPADGFQTFANTTGTSAAAVDVAITTEDAGAVLIRLTGGRQGVMWVSQVTAGRKNSLCFEISGTKGSMAWNSEAPETLWIGRRDAPNEILCRDPALMSEAVRRHTDHPGGHAEGFSETFKQLFRSFYTHAAGVQRSTEAPFPTFADGHHEITICEAIIASNRSRRWVDLAHGDHV